MNAEYDPTRDAKETGDFEVCMGCGTVVLVWARQQHHEWHEIIEMLKDNASGLLRATNERINRLLNGTVRLR